MPQFTQWTVPDPFPNILYNPAAVDAAIAKTQSELGNLDINRQKLALEQAREADAMAGGKRLIDSLTGNATGTTGATVGPLGDAAPDQSRDAAGQASYAFWVGKGLAPHQAAGMAAQEVAESGGRPHVVGDGGDAIGLYQHHAPRRQLILAKTGIDMTKPDANAQREGAYWELMNSEHEARRRLFASKDPDEAGRAATEFERPDSKRRAIIDAERGRDARRIFQLANPNGPAGVATASVDPRAGPRVGLTPPPPVTAAAPGITPPTAPAVDPNARVEADDPNMAAVKQASAALLNMPEPDAAAAYPAVVKELQARGFALRAPPTYPGHAALQALVGGVDAVAQTKTATRLGGTDVADASGVVVPTTAPAAPQPNVILDESGKPLLAPPPAPNKMMAGTGLPGVTIGMPGNTLAPSPTATTAPVTTAAPAAAPASPARPPVLQPPPALQRAIPPPQVLPSGLTPGETQIVAGMVQARTPTAQVATFIEAAKQRNTALQQQYLANQAAVDQANFERQKYYVEQQQKAEQTAHDRSREASYVWDADQGAYVDKSGAHPPVTPPSPRMTIAPDGNVIQAKPGGGVTSVYPADPAAITTRKAAETQGSEVGKDVGKQVPALALQGRNAATAIGNIDYGMNQVREAAKSGIPTGYFSQGLATAAAAAKSLGIDTTALGVDPAAVGNIQSAQKTLGVVAGAILQQAIGKDSQITDAKIQHFIHTQPGIETDPHAIERVLNWARSQFVYENEMSVAAMKEAAESPTGTLPLNWQPRYYRDKGFAPIYDPGSGEMRQPEGQQPTREPPPGPPPTAPVNPSERKADTVYQTPKGPLRWSGGEWFPVTEKK
jgi:hypothetical protein